jgi:hypothetical protein
MRSIDFARQHHHVSVSSRNYCKVCRRLGIKPGEALEEHQEVNCM